MNRFPSATHSQAILSLTWQIENETLRISRYPDGQVLISIAREGEGDANYVISNEDQTLVRGLLS